MSLGKSGSCGGSASGKLLNVSQPPKNITRDRATSRRTVKLFQKVIGLVLQFAHSLFGFLGAALGFVQSRLSCPLKAFALFRRRFLRGLDTGRLCGSPSVLRGVVPQPSDHQDRNKRDPDVSSDRVRQERENPHHRPRCFPLRWSSSRSFLMAQEFQTT